MLHSLATKEWQNNWIIKKGLIYGFSVQATVFYRFIDDYFDAYY